MSDPDRLWGGVDDATRPLFRRLPPLAPPPIEKVVPVQPVVAFRSVVAVEPARTRRRAYVAFRTVGELLGTAAVIVLLFLGYQVFVADGVATRQQEALADQVHERWERADPLEPPQQAAAGEALAVLHIPRLGAGYQRAVVEGTAGRDLAQGPGHYTDTALPGERGNFAVAGHRDGRGSPFQDLDALRPGDPVVVETVDSWFVYRVLGDPASGQFTGDPSGIPGRQIVRPEDVQVISPTPNAPADAAATGTYLTLTTCHPRYSAEQRLIIHAVLEGSALPKAQYPDGPSALQAG